VPKIKSPKIESKGDQEASLEEATQKHKIDYIDAEHPEFNGHCPPAGAQLRKRQDSKRNKTKLSISMVVAVRIANICLVSHMPTKNDPMRKLPLTVTRGAETQRRPHQAKPAGVGGGLTL